MNKSIRCWPGYYSLPVPLSACCLSICMCSKQMKLSVCADCTLHTMHQQLKCCRQAIAMSQPTGTATMLDVKIPQIPLLGVV